MGTCDVLNGVCLCKRNAICNKVDVTVGVYVISFQVSR